MYVVPELHNAGWSDDQIIEQKYFTDGRIIATDKRHFRKPGKKTDYILRYTPDFSIAVVEAKASFKYPGDGLQQAMNYAEILGLKFAYSTNGHGIVGMITFLVSSAGLTTFLRLKNFRGS